MKSQHLINGKKLNKNQLRTIKGGLLNCMEPVLCTTNPCEPSPYPNGCTTISISCAQKICRPEILP